MADSNSTYNARIVAELIKGNTLPKIEDIVKDLLISNGGILKKEVIDTQVSTIINLPMDNSIAKATSNSLDKLESKGIVINTSHGYWKAC